MKKIIPIVLFIVAATVVVAQQMPQYTQYLLNDYVYNPAIAGTRKGYEAKLNHREQWIGITDAPRTNVLSVFGPIKDNTMGVGGYLFTDINGHTRQIGAKFSYSYILKLNDQLKLSMGLYGGFMQFMIDGSKIVQNEDVDDPVLSGGLKSSLIPDAGLGFYLFHENYYVGLSAPQVLNNKINLYDDVETLGTLVGHYYALGGYRYQINDDFMINPNLLVKYVNPVPIQAEIMVMAWYKKMVNLGLSYRTEDALGLTLGYVYQDNISIGYSYDFLTSELSKYSSGSHEVMLGIKFLKRD